MIGGSTLCDGLYKVNLDNLYVETLMSLYHNVSTKRGLANDQSAYLSHKHLIDISKERMERLVKNEILPNLYFSNLSVCVWIVLKVNKQNTKK